LGRREHPDACDWELIEADHDLELIEAVQVIRVLRHGRAAHGELGVLECELHEKAAVRNAITSNTSGRVYVMHASPSHSIRKTPRNVAIHQFPRACLRLISSRSMKLLLLHVPISADCSVHAYFGPTENKLTELQLPDR
jgi:hypothetical protein